MTAPFIPRTASRSRVSSAAPRPRFESAPYRQHLGRREHIHGRIHPLIERETGQRLAIGAAALFALLALLAFAFIANPLAHFVASLAQ